MPYARRDGLELYYERAGDGEPELLFVPGWCCDTTFFAPQLEHFAATSAVTAFDPRGCGRSSVPADGYDIPSLADDVAWLCAEVGISRPVVVGHSLGAMVAIELAARHPSVPLAVVAGDPGPINPLPETMRMHEGFAEQMAGPAGDDVPRMGRGRCRADGERRAARQDRRDDVLRAAGHRRRGDPGPSHVERRRRARALRGSAAPALLAPRGKL